MSERTRSPLGFDGQFGLRYRDLFCSSLLFAALIGIASCGGDGTTDPPPPPPPPPPVAPVAVGSIPAQVMTAGQSVTVDVSPFFSDPDGGTLTYTAASSDDAVVSVSLSGGSLTVTGVAAGTATVTVTATDPDGLTATQSAGITVEAANRAPEAVGAIPPQTMTAGQSVTVDVSPFFSDPDGDALTYAAESSDADVVGVSVSGSGLTVTAVAAGTATVTVTATDPDGLTATQSAEVTVEAANRAPEAVGAIPAQTLTAGQSVTVDVSPFFSDPDGDALTYAAESSDADVVGVSVSGSGLTVTAVAAGTATVTVTATDPDGLTATQSAEVTVEAANRAPEAVGAIPAQTLTAGQSVTVDVSAFFSDPDGDELTYAAESSDADVLTVSVEGSGLKATAVAEGSATVTVTATDPDGLTATQSAEVTVEARGAGFRDDFDSEASLDDWELYSSSAKVVDGVLHLIGTASGLYGTADRVLETPVTDWVLGTRMARTETDELALLFWVSDHDRFITWRFVIGPHRDRNYSLAVFDSQSDSYVTITDFSGNSDAISDAANEFMDITFSHEDGEFALVVGDTELFKVTTADIFLRGVDLSDMVGGVNEVWLATGYDHTTLFDWVDLRGAETSARMANKPGVPGIDSRRLPGDLKRVPLDDPTATLSRNNRP